MNELCERSSTAEPAVPRGDGGSTPTRSLQLRKHEWEVRPAPFQEARSLVTSLHYSKGGSNTFVYVDGLYKIGGNELMGVAWWLPPTRVACESVNKEQWKRVLSLTRLVVSPEVPTNAASFLLSKSVLRIKKDRRFVSLVTYADESQGHTGGIYRASNWMYVGRTGPYPRWLCPSTGRQVSPKATVNRTKARMEKLGFVKQGSFFKHKFVLHLGNKD